MNKKIFNFGNLIILLLLVMTFFIWATILPISLRFSDYSVSTHSLGQITGLIGMALFALSFTLTTRLKIIERLFKGLDSVYKVHHHIGSISLVLLLFHPVLLVIKFIPDNFHQAAVYLWPSGSWAVNFGIVALLSMILLIVLTLYINLKYEKWKFSHRIFGVVFIAACLHIFLVTTDISRSLALRSWMFILCFIGLASHAYGSYIRKIIKQYEYQISEIETINKYHIIHLKPLNRVFSFKPGQFIFINFDARGFDEQHPFTIASSQGKTIRIIIKELGDYTRKISELKTGTKALIEGPYGVATLDNIKTRKTIWIAGGIGITPFLSYLNYLKSIKDQDKEIYLFYCTKNKDELIFLKELEEAGKFVKNLNIRTHCSIEKGFINIDVIKSVVKNFNDTTISICGPKPMIEGLKRQFMNSGVKADKILMEEFNLK
jgi:predicted ferric reductase